MTPTDLQPLPCLKIALTGGIASGKSMIRECLEKLGVPVIDADDVVHGLFAKDSQLRSQLSERFGVDIIAADGTVDRAKLGKMAFSDGAVRKQLEAWIHPKTRQIIAAFFKAQSEAGKPFAISVIPLLFESNLETLYDVVWLVQSTAEQQIQRLQAHRGMSYEDAQQRLDSQLPFEQKRQRLALCPDGDIIDNTASVENTRLQVEKLLSKFV